MHQPLPGPLPALPVGHAVCFGCHPNLDGPARCGTVPDTHAVDADVTCAVCADLDQAPCPDCQPNAHQVWMAMRCDNPQVP